ncbi:BON domain-containing protein [Vibrio rumoiensis]|uniref:BON domain-containing protein n=1 Tax=Vibrio rumoiensis 1S-45 TaxID=1188252 RepID=A0A1E5E1I2_9VIBR|nr:BON domain-containing protein [Vibrio rumoiensis]OEF24991.1 hypothetical protein A1QC_01685 [Vibrio rumoiensis 1S-45]
MISAKHYLVIGLLSLSGCANYFQENQSTSTTPDVRSGSQIWQEHQITSEVAALNNSPQFKGKMRVSATEDHSRVVLMGQAINDDTRLAAADYVAQLSGVKKVFNQIRVKPILSFNAISYDSWLTTKVKAELLTEHRLDGLSIKVVTEDKEVFLSGLVSAENAELASQVASRVSGVKHVVKAFTYTK